MNAAHFVGGNVAVFVQVAGPDVPECRERWGLRACVGDGGKGHVSRVEEGGVEEWGGEGREGVG